MNSANPAKSKRLQRVVKLLSSGREFSTMEISNGAQVMAVSAAVSELRDRGFSISCERRGDVWFYRMATNKSALAQAVGL